MRVTRRGLLVAAAVAAALLLVARVAAAIYADFAWYEALGAAPLWRAKVGNTVLLRGTAWAAGTVAVFLNLYAVRGSVLRLIVPRRVANIEIDAEVPGRLLVGGAGLVALGVGALLMLAQDDWTTLAAARYARPFGESDNYFSHDLSFWTAWLPLERAWFTWAEVTLVVVCCMVIALYVLTASLRWERGVLHVAPYVRRHFAVLGALLLLLLAWSYRLERYLLVVDGGPSGYFGYAEQGSLTPLLVLSVLTAACAFLVLWAGFTGQTRLAFAGVTLAIVLAVGLQQLTPALLRWQARDLSERRTVDPYLGTRGTFTKRAYGVQGRVDAADSTALFPDLASLEGRVAVWDDPAILAAVERSTRRRTVAGAVGWSAGEGGRLRAVVPVREEVGPSLGDGAERWLAVVAGVDEDATTIGGTLRLSSRPLAPVLVSGDASGYLVAADPAGAVAAPALDRPWRRLAHALAVQNLRLYAAPARRARTVIVAHRDVRERVHRLAPTFALGSTVAPLLHGDSLYWAVHLYAASRTYPLSQPLPGSDDGGGPAAATKYLRHAGTALVNAHTGRVLVFRTPDAEPVARSWMARFPGIYQPWSAAPASLRTLAPPPIEAALAQAFALEVAGGVGLEPGRVRTAEEAGDSVVAAILPVPYLAPGDSAVTAVALPLVERAGSPTIGGEDGRLRALVVATGGSAPRTVVVPVDVPTAAWPAILEMMGSAARTTAPSGDGDRLVFGRVRALPTRQGAVLVRPAFDWRADGEPSLRVVTAMVGDSVRSGTSLRDALRPPADSASGAGPGPDAATLYQRMREALRVGDWRSFGEAFDELGRRLGPPAGR